MSEKRNFYSTNEVLNMFNGLISRAQLSNLMREGKIPVLSFKRKKLIRAEWVNDVMSGKIEVI